MYKLIPAILVFIVTTYVFVGCAANSFKPIQFKRIQCDEPRNYLAQPLYLGLKAVSRPLAQMKKGDEAVVQLSGANGFVVEMDELMLRYEPDSNLEVIGPATATFRNVPYAAQQSDNITPKIRVRLKGDGGELRVFYAALYSNDNTPKKKRALATEAKILGITIGFGNRAEGAPQLNIGSLADLVARALEPCVKESMHCFAEFLGQKFTVIITFASSGTVQNVEVDGVNEPIPSCVKERIARMSVPPFEGTSFKVQIPLVMSDQKHYILRAE